MGREDGHAILSSACFQLGIAGAQITRSFSLLIQHTGLTHKQVGLLAVVDAGVATSQREIATQLHVAPSLVVTLVDQLTRSGAVRRTRSRSDRRVQTIEITDEGRRLLKAATDVASRLDADLRAPLSPDDQQALDRLLPSLLHAAMATAQDEA
ncbi:MarR family winged helix-turn-helix transcriptional regulator [Actinomyces sp.]|uniref:MarR family winged helix-turn-helix transcriptional regulator n=1 Tax=Actinomyces sp. TaxID=29317 RepID=UPI0026DB3CF6|nr:MarR family winged helix-turn-helix transcriptional regulator [Actinomyces sp.]MDO4655596.1 MarR family winged helix-turn-helix transcriptional regulator [Actinomyces sp.]